MARSATAAFRLLSGEREPVRLATTGNITLAGLQTIDGVLTETGDRVLVKNQTDATTNGIYGASAGTWYRTSDARSFRTLQKGTTVHVQQGTVAAGHVYSFQTYEPNIGTDDIDIAFYTSDDTLAGIAESVADAIAQVQAEGEGIIDQAEASAALAAGYASDAASMGNTVYDNVAGMGAITIPIAMTSIRVNGATAAGDGGGGTYTKQVSEPAAGTAKLQTLDGAWWLRTEGLIHTPNIRSFILNPSENLVDPDATAALLLAPGSATQPCKMGIDNAWTVHGQGDAGLTAFMEWGADDYDVNTSGVDLSTIVGGYDNINNGYASHIFGGLHAMIGASVEGHNVIVGGADNYVAAAAGRAGIFGARRAAILTADNNVIVGGDFSKMTTDASRGNTIINGVENEISSGRLSVILGGELNTVTGLSGGAGSNHSTVLGGSENESAANYGTIIGGTRNKVATYGAQAVGKDVLTVAGGGFHHGIDKMVQQGDAQFVRYLSRYRTTDALIHTMDSFGIAAGTGYACIMPAISIFSGVATLIGLMDGSAGGNNDGVYTQVMYRTEFGGVRDGTNAFLFKAGTETTKTAADKTLALDIVAQANNTFTPAGTPILYLTAAGGALRVRTYGVAAKIINWVATFEITMTRVGP